MSLLFFAVGRDLRGRLKQSFVARRQESNESEGSCRTRQCFHVVFFALRRPYGCRACQEPGKIFLQHCAQCRAAHSFAFRHFVEQVVRVSLKPDMKFDCLEPEPTKKHDCPVFLLCPSISTSACVKQFFAWNFH